MQGAPGEGYTLGGGNELTNLALVRMLCDGLEARRPRKQGRYEDLITFVEDRPGHDRRYLLDSSKIRRELGWAPSVAFEAGLPETVHWYRDHPEWWRPLLPKAAVQEAGWTSSPTTSQR